MNKKTWTAIGAVVVISAFAGYQFLGNDKSAGSEPGSANAAASGKPAGGGRGSGRGGRPAPLVVAGEVTQSLINDRLKAVGNGTAVASVSIVPLSGGVLEEVLVSPGERVEANAVLAKLDSEEQQIARDRAARESEEAEADAVRLEKLFRSRTATQVELNRARADLNDAQLALRDAELKLGRRTITAPITGIVGFVSVDTGNYINAQTELMTIDDRSELIVEFWVPERFANQVSSGQSVEVVALADPSRQYQGVVSGIGSRIEQDSRTLPMQALVDNSADTLRPGMSFEMMLNFPGQQFAAVNPLAIQWDSTGSYVWQIVENKAQRVAARIIQRNPEAVLIDSELTPGDQVVTEGVMSVRQGAAVRVEGAQAKRQPPADGKKPAAAQERPRGEKKPKSENDS